MINIDSATEEQLLGIEKEIVNFHEQRFEQSTNDCITDFVLANISVNEDGRLIVPALWNNKILHRLPSNYWLASNILNSVLNRIGKDKEKLKLYDEVIQQQISSGVLEVVDLSSARCNKRFHLLLITQFIGRL